MPLRANLLQKIASHQGDVLSCCFSGRLLAVGSADKLVRLFALVQDGYSFGELPQSPLCGHNYAVNFVHFTPLGTLLATCSQDGKVIIWDVRTGNVTSGVAKGGLGGPRWFPPQTPGRLRRKNVAGGSAPRPPPERGLGRSPK